MSAIKPEICLQIPLGCRELGALDSAERCQKPWVRLRGVMMLKRESTRYFNFGKSGSEATIHTLLHRNHLARG